MENHITAGSIRHKIIKLALTFTLFGSFFLLALQPDLRLAIPMLVGVAAVIVITLGGLFWLGERGRLDFSPATILSVALLLRLLFLAAPPGLSDDIYRYLWDGLQLLGGHNPYAFSPAAAPAAAGLEALRASVNHPDLVTIYPPAAQLLFAAGAAFGGGVTGLKLLLVLLDLIQCAVILRLLANLDLPPSRAVLYAWNPLPVLEIASSGHIDGAAMLCLLVTLLLLLGRRERPRSPLRAAVAGGCFAAAVLIKLFPLVFLPALLILSRGAIRSFLAGFCGAAAALSLPFLPELGHALGTLDLYLRNWEFAGFGFRVLRDLSTGATARLLLGLLFLAATGLIYRQAARRGDARGAIEAIYGVALAFLLLTTTLHPWYALYLAALLPLAAGASGLVLCWGVLLGYQVLIPYAILGQWVEQGWVAAVIFFAPLLAWLAARGLGSGLPCRSPRGSSLRPGSPRPGTG